MRTRHQARWLSPRAWGIAWEIAWLAVAVELGLRVLPLPRLLAMIRRLRPRRTTIAAAGAVRPDLAELQRLTAGVLRRAPFPMTCLRQTLIMFALLRRRDLPADLKVGLSKTGDTLQAHAWIEHDGRVLLDDSDVAQRFSGVLSLESC